MNVSPEALNSSRIQEKFTIFMNMQAIKAMMNADTVPDAKKEKLKESAQKAPDAKA